MKTLTEGLARELIENDKLEIEGWRADQKENLKNQCDLVAERDTWKARCEFSFKERDKLLTTNAGLVRDKESDRLAYLAMRNDRDAYQQAADTQAMAHKVERDGLTTLIDKALYALEYASDMTKPEGLGGCDCPTCTTIFQINEMKAGVQ